MSSEETERKYRGEAEIVVAATSQRMSRVTGTGRGKEGFCF